MEESQTSRLSETYLQKLSQLPTEDRKLQTEMARCRVDSRWHLENHFSILDKNGDVRLMNPLKDAQLRLLAIKDACHKLDMPLRIIILKARKEGISTLIEAFGYLEAKNGKSVLVIAHDKETSKYIFGITYRFHRNYDLPKPNVPKPSRKHLKFSSQEGEVLVETANNLQAGTGTTPHFIHGSEVAKWVKGSETATALFQAIGDSPETSVFLESTAYGYDSLFYPYWKDAWEQCRVTFDPTDHGYEATIEVQDRLEWNGYVPLFIPWFEDPDYVRQFQDQDERQRFLSTLSSYSKTIQERFGLTDEQLFWYETTCLKEKCQWTSEGSRKAALRRRKQEYPSFPEEAFVSTGNVRFDTDKLDLQQWERPTAGYLTQDQAWGRQIRFISDQGGLIHRYRPPIRNHRYLISIDVAEGLKADESSDPDETVAHVYDIDGGAALEQVAVIAGQFNEEEMVEPVKMLAAYYNMAFISVLTSGGRGEHLCIELSKIYPSERILQQNGRWGLKEHIGTKPVMVSDLAKLIEDDEILVYDRNTLAQMRQYKKFKNKTRAEAGFHDDHVSSAYAAAKTLGLYPQHLKAAHPGVIPSQSMFELGQRRSEMDKVGGYSIC